MFCKKCYTRLPEEPAGLPLPVEHAQSDRTLDYATKYFYACPRCGRRFDPSKPRTYARRQFPSGSDIISTLFATTIFGTVAALVVAFHQLAAMSGH
jgi:hypothetical protein